jgi:hypothetical protein
MSTKDKTRKEHFIEEINAAMNAGPYKNQDKHLHQLYCIGLLRELLAYSAVDLMEIRERVRDLATRSKQPKSGQ